MKTEVFSNKTDEVRVTTDNSPISIAEVTILDPTPESSPVGTPISTDSSSDYSGDSQADPDTEEISKGNLRYNANPIDIPPCKNRRKRRSSEGRYRELEFDELYTLKDETLGRGAYGCVQTCVDKKTQKEFAVKEVEIIDTATRKRLKREVEIYHLCRDHPNIVNLLRFFWKGIKGLLVFEKIYGGSLSSHLEKSTFFGEIETRNVIHDISQALTFLHSKDIAHRDLKPENILCLNTHKVYPVKICDFDLSSDVKTQTFSCAPELVSPVGSPEYMAPEVATGFLEDVNISYDKNCDLWSLGVIMYIMLSGKPPFVGSCNFNCGWENGNFCQTCHDSLFSEIQKGYVNFRSKRWSFVSDDAKSLILSLLIKNPRSRLPAEKVLLHPWIKKCTAHFFNAGRIPRNESSMCLYIDTTAKNTMERLNLDSEEECLTSSSFPLTCFTETTVLSECNMSYAKRSLQF